MVAKGPLPNLLCIKNVLALFGATAVMLRILEVDPSDAGIPRNVRPFWRRVWRMVKSNLGVCTGLLEYHSEIHRRRNAHLHKIFETQTRFLPD